MIKPLILIVVFGAALAMIFAGAAPSMSATTPANQPTKELTLDLGDKATMKLVFIPAGTFLMGGPETIKYLDADQTQHEVTISKPFYMGQTHVTVDQFAAFVKDTGYKTEAEKAGSAPGFTISNGKLDQKSMPGISWRNPSFDQKGDHPVVQVSWNDSKAFCDWLSKKSGKTVTLPTEAQWEYACRAGTKTAYPWGDNPDDGNGWANCCDQRFKQKLPNMPDNRLCFHWDDGFVFTSPVKSFKPNAFGLYDMIGNAAQWCTDWYGDYAKGPVTDPKGPEAGHVRVYRGGSWDDLPSLCRSPFRSLSLPDSCGFDLGFRVAVAGGE